MSLSKEKSLISIKQARSVARSLLARRMHKIFMAFVIKEIGFYCEEAEKELKNIKEKTKEEPFYMSTVDRCLLKLKLIKGLINYLIDEDCSATKEGYFINLKMIEADLKILLKWINSIKEVE